MPSITIAGEAGQITVTVDGGQPVPVKSAEEACAIVEQTFDQPDGDEQEDEDYMAGVGQAKSGMM